MFYFVLDLLKYRNGQLLGRSTRQYPGESPNRRELPWEGPVGSSVRCPTRKAISKSCSLSILCIQHSGDVCLLNIRDGILVREDGARGSRGSGAQDG